MATVSDNIIYLLVGFALTIEIPYVLRPDLPGTTLSLDQVRQSLLSPSPTHLRLPPLPRLSPDAHSPLTLHSLPSPLTLSSN